MAAPKKPRRRANREGSVYFDKRLKLWRAAVSPAPGSQGPRRYASGKTQAEALKARDALKREMGVFSGRPGDIPTLAEFWESWLATKEQVLRLTSLRSYKVIWEHYLRESLGGERLDKLTAHRLQLWVNAMGRADLGPSKIKNALALVRSILSSAVRQQLVATNAAKGNAIELPRYASQAPTWLDPQEGARFIVAAQESDLGALLVLILTTGMRVGEARALRWADIDLGTGMILVSRQLQRLVGRWVVTSPKGDKSRVLYAPRVALDMLIAWKASQDAARAPDWPAEHEGWIWLTEAGTPFHLSLIRTRLEAVIEAAQVPRVTIHQLRHSTGSIMLALGSDIRTIQEVLGHSDSRQTTRTYVHVQEELLRAAAERLGRGLEGPQKGNS